MDIGLLAAFLGGTLALLSPCGALLLPAFFASSVTAGFRLWLHALVFYAGLVLVLVPLGLGAGAVGAIFITYRAAIVAVSALLLVAFGVVQLLGLGFDPARLVPGAQGLQARAAQRTGLVKTLLLGGASGLAGFCSGPILGAVLTLAAARGDVLLAGGLLAVYAAGMVVPLLALAWAWHRLSDRSRRALRGRTFTVLGRELHSTSVITGLLLIGVGVLFWATNGLVTAPALVPPALQLWLQERSALLTGPVVDIAAIVAGAGAVLVLWVRRGRGARGGRGGRDGRDSPGGRHSQDGQDSRADETEASPADLADRTPQAAQVREATTRSEADR